MHKNMLTVDNGIGIVLVLYTGSVRRFQIYCTLAMEMPENAFSFVS